MRIDKETFDQEMFLDIVLTEQEIKDLKFYKMPSEKVKLFGHWVYIGVRVNNDED